MTTQSKKYAYKVDQDGASWRAQITRQITSKKTVVSKAQDGFENEAEAKAWAEQELLEFTSTLGKSNQRHGKQRKHLEEVRRNRSNRRADKTQLAKDDASVKEEPESDEGKAV